MMSTPSRQYATDVTDVQWRRIEPLLPASMAAERSGSATAGSTPDRQRPFVSDQDRLSLGLVAFLFWTVENGV